jgi:hypothetical protein
MESPVSLRGFDLGFGLATGGDITVTSTGGVTGLGTTVTLTTGHSSGASMGTGSDFASTGLDTGLETVPAIPIGRRVREQMYAITSAQAYRVPHIPSDPPPTLPVLVTRDLHFLCLPFVSLFIHSQYE